MELALWPDIILCCHYVHITYILCYQSTRIQHKIIKLNLVQLTVLAAIVMWTNDIWHSYKFFYFRVAIFPLTLSLKEQKM